MPKIFRCFNEISISYLIFIFINCFLFVYLYCFNRLVSFNFSIPPSFTSVLILFPHFFCSFFLFWTEVLMYLCLACQCSTVHVILVFAFLEFVYFVGVSSLFSELFCVIFSLLLQFLYLYCVYMKVSSLFFLIIVRFFFTSMLVFVPYFYMHYIISVNFVFVTNNLFEVG